MAGADFNSLVAERAALRNYVLIHAGSLFSFKEEDQPWFRRQEKPDARKKEKKRKLRHLTTTASCLESLNDVPVYEAEDPPPPCPRDGTEIAERRTQIIEDFTQATLKADDSDWKTESEQLVYSRVRTLPVILSLASDHTLEQFAPQLGDHLKSVWDSLKISDAMTQGIGERPKPSAPDGEGYPPNAFHTYWAIRLLREYRTKPYLSMPSSKMREREAVAQLWSRRTLATQTALISSGQRTVDAQQLAWALSTDVLCRADDGDQPTTADHQHTELYEAALAAFFSEQEDGRWRLYEPLFHYAQAGNAYCYTYETLAELLRLALRKRQGRVLRDRLRTYAGNLIDAWHYARDTALDLESGGLGWCSGHHPHRTKPEAWATASVFSYLQNLRCLIGHWASEEAKLDLSVQPSDSSSISAGEELLGGRGDTWARVGTQTVGRQLAMLFLHPLRATMKGVTVIDPDTPLVDESRSAVLFGPPGTSKTTVVEGLAKALNWDYVEVHASSFLSEGMDSVPKSADSIFQKLMELDHCVILFDEIDELIRLRDDDGSDPFGRFLTTSMLPKLAKLWEQRRVLFFVATNDIEAADPAIKRSQRFDAAMFVPPPSFEKKKERLKEVLSYVPPRLTAEAVEKALAGTDHTNAHLGVFAFLRWDQIDDLANRIEILEEKTGSQDALKEALGELGRELERTDWKRSASTHSNRGEEGEPGEWKGGSDYPHGEMFQRWNQQKFNERRDYRAAAVLRLMPDLVAKRPQDWMPYKSNEGYLTAGPAIDSALEMHEDGTLQLDGNGWKATDSAGIFSFEGE